MTTTWVSRCLFTIAISVVACAHCVRAAEALYGFTPPSSKTQRAWEEKFRAIPDPKILRETMQRLSARPHHVGSPYDKDNAEWLLARFKSWGLDAHIEQYDVLFPTPKERVVELVEPRHFSASLREPPVAGDLQRD